MAKQFIACFGDSITSEMSTGIGSIVARKLGLPLCGNFAIGYATLTDWHDGNRNTTPVDPVIPMNVNEPCNVVSNQIRRFLIAVAPKGQEACRVYPGCDLPKGVPGQGLVKPSILYLAAGTNDGNNPQNLPYDDTDVAFGNGPESLARCGMASSLRWAVEKLRLACPDAEIFAASPLQAAPANWWMQYETGMLKREIIRKTCDFCGIHFIDSFLESGFTEEIAPLHGEVHPDLEWRNLIADFVAGEIRKICKL